MPRAPSAAGLSSQDPLLILTLLFFVLCLAPTKALEQHSLGEGILSQKPEGSNRTAEGQGQPRHSVLELATSLKPREHWEEELWNSVLPSWPLSGQQGKGL